jgi:hypothetical protein
MNAVKKANKTRGGPVPADRELPGRQESGGRNR